MPDLTSKEKQESLSSASVSDVFGPERKKIERNNKRKRKKREILLPQCRCRRCRWLASTLLWLSKVLLSLLSSKLLWLSKVLLSLSSSLLKVWRFSISGLSMENFLSSLLPPSAFFPFASESESIGLVATLSSLFKRLPSQIRNNISCNSKSYNNNRNSSNNNHNKNKCSKKSVS